MLVLVVDIIKENESQHFVIQDRPIIINESKKDSNLKEKKKRNSTLEYEVYFSIAPWDEIKVGTRNFLFVRELCKRFILGVTIKKILKTSIT